MDQQAFTLLMAELATIKEQNKQQIDLIHGHIKDDAAVHAVVDRHSTYFKTIGLGVPGILAWITKKLGLY